MNPPAPKQDPAPDVFNGPEMIDRFADALGKIAEPDAIETFPELREIHPKCFLSACFLPAFPSPRPV